MLGLPFYRTPLTITTVIHTKRNKTLLHQSLLSFCLTHEKFLLFIQFFLQPVLPSASIVRENGDGFTISSLLVSYASRKESGVYQCNPSNTGPASINVHVLDGEYYIYIHGKKALKANGEKHGRFWVCNHNESWNMWLFFWPSRI